MGVTESQAIKNLALAGRLAFLDTGPSAARIRLYDGARTLVSADPDAGNTLIAEIVLTKPSGAVVANALRLFADGAGSVVATGTPIWARVVNGEGATAFDMDVGIAGSGANCIISDEIVYAGGVVSVLSAVLT